jgi:transcriptional regulator with XRE-family HTH domain
MLKKLSMAPKEQLMNLAQRIRELRTTAKMSQAELAKLMSVSRNAVSQWESGETQPSTKRLIVLAQILKVQLDQLIAPTSGDRERVIVDATRLFSRLGFEETSLDVICAATDITVMEFDALFTSKEELLYEVAKVLHERKLDSVRRTPPKYGTLAARLKYLLRMHFDHDVAYLKLTAAMQAYSWRWNEARERDHARYMSEYQVTLLALFEEAEVQGQISQGNFGAASNLIIALYTTTLRRAVYDGYDADKLVALVEPQIALILAGLNYKVVPGFAEGTP